jgi:hypothetical protein
MIKQGWDRCELSGVLEAAQQVEAKRFCINEPTEVLGEEVEETELNVTDSEGEEDTDEAD